MEFDYVIVGAGSAGSALAGRLAEYAAGSIAVIEAGRTLWPKITAIPASIFRTIGHPDYDWGYHCEPDPSRDGRSEHWPRGKGPGGTSLINGLIFIRGHCNDYQAWAELGCQGWDYQSVLPYFRRLESTDIGDDRFRGRHGPQPVSTSPYLHPLTDMVIEAAGEAGIAFNPDLNGRQQIGIGHSQITHRGGRRVSAFDAFLAEPVSKGRVTLLQQSRALRVLLDRGRACGVETMAPDGTRQILARKKVILAGGAINSPQLLMLSGIGPARLLSELGISCLVDSPEVGENMREHVGIWMQAEVDVPTVNRAAQPLGLAWAMAQWLLGRGPATASPANAIGFPPSLDRFGRPELQISFLPLGMREGPRGVEIPDRNLISIIPSISHPQSVGRVRLASADPSDPPKIFSHILEADADRAALARGIRLCEKILSSGPLRDHVVEVLDPPPAEDGAALDAYIRRSAAPVYHTIGTCRMGADEASVVAPDLHVRGVEGLMVADASIMPAHISGNIQAACLMIGDRAAEFV